MVAVECRDVLRADACARVNRLAAAGRLIVGTVALVDPEAGLAEYKLVRAGAQALHAQYLYRLLLEISCAIQARHDDRGRGINRIGTIEQSQGLGDKGRAVIVLARDRLLLGRKRIACGCITLRNCDSR